MKNEDEIIKLKERMVLGDRLINELSESIEALKNVREKITDSNISLLNEIENLEEL